MLPPESRHDVVHPVLWSVGRETAPRDDVLHEDVSHQFTALGEGRPAGTLNPNILHGSKQDVILHRDFYMKHRSQGHLRRLKS